MGLGQSLKQLRQKLADKRAASAAQYQSADDADSSSTPRIQHPEKYDTVDLDDASAGFPPELR